jgi:hypothetical protein
MTILLPKIKKKLPIIILIATENVVVRLLVNFYAGAVTVVILSNHWLLFPI